MSVLIFSPHVDVWVGIEHDETDVRVGDYDACDALTYSYRPPDSLMAESVTNIQRSQIEFFEGSEVDLKASDLITGVVCFECWGWTPSQAPGCYCTFVWETAYCCCSCC